MRRSRAWAAGITALTVAAVIGGSGVSAFAGQDDKPSPSDRPTLGSVSPQDEEIYEQGDVPPGDLANQAVWTAFLDEIDPYVNDGDVGVVAAIDGQESRYGSLIVDQRSLSADLYWAGELPDVVAAAIAHHPLVTVNVHRSAYSLAELISARDKLMDRWDTLAPKGFTILMLGPASDASGISLTLTATGDAKLPTSESESLSREIADITGVKPIVTVSDITVDYQATRQSDISPFYGGAGISLSGASDSSYCSTGASVVGRTSGNPYMTTAFHCIYELGGTSGSVTTPAGTTVGTWNRTAAGVEKARDAALISIPSPKTNSGASYWGTYSSSASQLLDGYQVSNIGDSVCASGARSGATCDVIVTDKNFAFPGIDSTPLKNMVKAVRTASSGFVSVNGDSGGPVLVTQSSNHYLRGFIVAGGGATHDQCGTGSDIYHFNASDLCSNILFYAGGVGGYLDDLNVDLK